MSGSNFRDAKREKLAKFCAAEVLATGAHPHMIDSGSAAVNKEISVLSEQGIKAHGVNLLERMKQMQGYIRITDDADQSKINLPANIMQHYKAAKGPMTAHRVNHTRWLVVAAPTKEFAADCGMTLPKFESFYRDVCLLNYGLMTEAVKPLQKIMAEGKKVRILSPAQETELTFSIEGIDAIPCTGVRNIPDGECYTAPVKHSINGTIKYGPSNYDGQRFAFIKATFQDGRIVKAEAENPERTATLNAILDADEGARYIGEFAINFNPYVQHPTGSILFDEKIDGGIHLAAGACYDQASNGNKSVNHWDMVHIQRPDYGGGEIWIDDRLIRKDGIFVVPELFALNPDNLKAATKPAVQTARLAPG